MSVSSSGGWRRCSTRPCRELRLRLRSSAATRAWRSRAPPLRDADDLVGEVAGRNLDEDLLALLLAEQRAADRALVADPVLGRPCLGRTDDRGARRLAGLAGVDPTFVRAASPSVVSAVNGEPNWTWSVEWFSSMIVAFLI